jgi:hypothetical protein
MLDIFAVSGLEWVYDKVEDRYGRAAALLVTTALAFAILGAALALILALF